MQRKLILITISLFLTALFSSINNAQVVEKDGVFYRDFILNPASDTISDLTKTDEITSAAYTEPPIIKPDFMVNTTDGEYGADQFLGGSAIDGNGNYAFTWLDYRNGVKEIFAQFYNSNDVKVGNIIKINESSLIGNNNPSIGTNINGDFVIVWLSGFGDVKAQLFTKNALRIGGNIQVNSSGGMNNSIPSVAVNDNGSFIVVWKSDTGNGYYQVYARIFDSNGYPISSEIFVNESDLRVSSIGQNNLVSTDANGNYCVTWSSYDNSTFSNVYLQIINNSGQKIGFNTKVSTSADSSDSLFPEIASTDDGHFLIVWNKKLRYQILSGISARIFHTENLFLTGEIVISEPDVWGDIFKISSDRDSCFLILYASRATYFQRLSRYGEFTSDTVNVIYNTDMFEYPPAGIMTDFFNDHFFVSLTYYNRKDANIYFQKFNGDLSPVGALNKITDDYGSAWQSLPLVHFNNMGESIVLWEDERNGRYDLYAQIYDNDYNTVGNNIQINETTDRYWSLLDKKVYPLSDGSFVIAFSRRKPFTNGSEIYLQIVNASGDKTGNNKLVKEEFYTSYIAAIKVNSADEILICWYNLYGVSIRKYDKNFSPLSNEYTVISYTNPGYLYTFAASIDNSFNLFTVWTAPNTQNYTTMIKGRFFNEKGIAVTDSFNIDDASSFIQNLECKNDNGNFAVAYRQGGQVYLTRKYDLDKEYSFKNTFSSYGSLSIQLNLVEFKNQKVFLTYNSPFDVIGFYANDNKRVSGTFLLHKYEHLYTFLEQYNGSNSAAVYDENLLFAFESNKNGGTGLDIWANVRNIKDVDFKDEYFYPPSDKEVLYTNFPNPFNLKTKISYELIAYGKVKLSVYDVLGREVKILVDDYQESGVYEVDFDASGLASGIYIYRLEAFNPITKKMILLK